MSPTFSNCGYTVTVENDRSILVKPGDWISKYAAAIYGDPKANWDRFKKKVGREYRPLDDPYKIVAGHRVYHPDPLPGERSYIPLPPGRRRAPAAAPGKPAGDGELMAERLYQFFAYLEQWLCPVNDWVFKNSSGGDLSGLCFTGQYMRIKARHLTEQQPYFFHAVGAGLGLGPEDIAASLSISPPKMWGKGYIGKCINAGRTLSADEICGSYLLLDFSFGLFVGGSVSLLLFGINGPLQSMVRTVSRYLRGEPENILILPSLFQGAMLMAGTSLTTPNFGVSFKLGLMHRWECLTG
jgi:hypothetical protein